MCYRFSQPKLLPTPRPVEAPVFAGLADFTRSASGIGLPNDGEGGLVAPLEGFDVAAPQ